MLYAPDATGGLLRAEARTDRRGAMLRELSARGGGHRGTGHMSDATSPGHAVSAEPTTSRSRLLVITSLGIAQILAWGSSYYLLAVLAGPIAKDTGWPLTWIMGALSIGLLVSGLVSPRVGHFIDQRGGRPVLAASAGLLAGGMLLLGIAPNMPMFVAAWVVIGLGMGAGLYDPAFSTLGRLYGEHARSAITQLTLSPSGSLSMRSPRRTAVSKQAVSRASLSCARTFRRGATGRRNSASRAMPRPGSECRP